MAEIDSSDVWRWVNEHKGRKVETRPDLSAWNWKEALMAGHLASLFAALTEVVSFRRFGMGHTTTNPFYSNHFVSL